MRFVAGAAPGTLLVHPDAPAPEIEIFAYSKDDLEERPIEDLSELDAYEGLDTTLWVNVVGLGDGAVLEEIGRRFGLHRLLLEDIVNVGQRPKAEAFDESLFVVATMAAADGTTEQLSLVLEKGSLLSFQERHGDSFEGVRDRLRRGRPTIRRSGADYLAYALIDAVIDAYFPLVQEVQDELEALEEEVISSPNPECLARIHRLKSKLRELRRILTPQREAINSLLRDADGFIEQETAIHLRDCYDHLLRLIELVEVAREQCSDLMNTYLSSQSNRMNEVMKVLTIIATIFIPLGFVAGLYGMNFDPDASPWNMPELGLYFGYPVALLVMAGIALGLLFAFWRKGWFRS